MAKKLNIDLNVIADTSKARASFQDLQNQLSRLQNSTTINIQDKTLQQAQKAAGELAYNLQQATNVNTGKLNLNQFSQSLAKSGKDLKQIHAQLSQLGPEGEQAFFKLTQSIASADAATINLGTKLTQLGTVLKNTVRWQLSSSILHGFMGALQGAYGYAQDLNLSLNNIRIVTGQDTEQMARFAAEANKAAKSLSSTTTAYTDAALIYYQQGLSDSEVKERTETTLKLSNVSRQSAEEVSSQLTAIWNNFDDGTKKLEYYADVITALGAATASSSDEIAQGLSQFASVADTVGLSYEKATAALATVVAETRQSADVVGTAFKTIFARVQGLSLGETLEDGVDLNKYSKALKTVGVDVLDANNNIKEMDVLLDELGNKWQNITKAERTALAQTVAGTRQYTQFMAIMENYDKIRANESIAEGSEGTLQKQADTYAESWEAARDRVKAAAQEIYDQLLNDKAFIDILNGFEKFLEFISNIIDGLGGLKGILLLIGSIFTQVYAKEMPHIMEILSSNIAVITNQSQKRAQSLLKETQNELELNYAIEQRDKQNQALAVSSQVVTKMTEALNNVRKNLSETEIEAYENEINYAKALGNTTEALGKEINAINNSSDAITRRMKAQFHREGVLDNVNTEKETPKEERVYSLDSLTQQETQIEQAKQKVEEYKQKIEEAQRVFDEDPGDKSAKSRLGGLTTALTKAKQRVFEFEEAYKNMYGQMSGKDTLKVLEQEAKNFGKMQAVISITKGKTDQWKQSFQNLGKIGQKSAKELKEEIEKYSKKLKEAGLDTSKLEKALKEVDGSEGFNEVFSELENVDEILTTLGDNAYQTQERIWQLQARLRALGASDKDIEELTTLWEQGGIATEEYEAKIEQLKQKLGEVPQHTVKMSEGLTQMGSAIMQVSMAINSIQNLGNIWSNEDISTGEKILQTMITMGMLIPTVIGLINKEKIAQMGAVAARILGINATVMQTTAEGASIPVKIASGNAGWYALGPLLLFVGIAAAVIAAIVGIVAVLSNLINAETEEEKALRLANEELERSKEVANEAKQAYEDLKNKVSDYDSAVEALKKCTKGTQEWRDAFTEVLSQVAELIASYPQLLQYENLYNENGTLNQEVLHKAVNFSERASINAANNQIVASLQQQRANLNNEISNIVNNLKTTSGLYKTETKKIKSSHVGQPDKEKTVTVEERYTKKLENGNTTTIGAQTAMENVVRDAIAKNIKFTSEGDVKNFVFDYLKSQEQIIGDDFKDATKVISDALINSADKLQKLGKETDNLATQMYNASNVIFENYFSNIDFENVNQEIAYQQAYDEIIGETTKKIRSGMVAGYVEDFENNRNVSYEDEKYLSNNKTYGNEQYSTKEYLNLINRYAAENNLELDDEGKPLWKDGKVFVKFKGMKEEDFPTIEEIYSKMLPILLEEEKDSIIDLGNEYYSKINKTSIDAASYFKVKGNFNEVSYKEIQDSIFDGEGKQKSFEDIFNNDDAMKENVANKLRIKKEDVNEEDIESVKATYNKQVLNAMSVFKEVPQYIRDSLGEDLVKNIDIGALEKVGKMYTKALAREGEAGAEILNNIVDAAGDESADVMAALSNMDFSTLNIEDANKELANLGLQFELSEGQFYSLKNTLKDVSTVTADSAKETYKSVSSVLSKLKSEGDIIEDEDYQKLLAVNPAISSFFTTMADGTHMLTGAAQDFKTAVQSATINELYNAQKNSESTAAAYGELSQGYTKKASMSGDNLWSQYQDQTLAQIQVLRDNNKGDLADSLQAQINTWKEEGGDLTQVVLDAAEAYEELNLSTEDYTTKAEAASKEAANLAEAIKETYYQNEIANAGLEYETTENYANVLMELYEAEGLSKEAARELSIANQRLDRGLSSLNDNFEDWSDSLKKTNKASLEYAKTIVDIRKSFADLLNIADGNELSLKWLEKWMNNSQEMKKILDGDAEAIQSFRESAFSEMTSNVFEDVKNSAQELLDTLEDPKSDRFEILSNLIDQLDDGKISAEGLKQELQTLGDDNIGGEFSLSENYTNTLNEMLKQGLLTEQQLNDIFASIGYKPKVHTEQIDQVVKVPNYNTIETVTEEDLPSPEGSTGRRYQRTISTETVPGTPPYKEMHQSVPVVQIDGSGKKGGNIEIVNAGSTSITPSYDSTTSGKAASSKSSDKKNTSAASHEHEVNRYSDEENAIKGLSDQYARLNEAKDKAFGKSRIQAMEQELKKLKELKQASSNYLDAIVGAGNASKVAKAIYNGENVGAMIAGGQVGGTARQDYNSLFSGVSASGKGLEYTAKDNDGNERLVSDNYSLSGFNALFGSNLKFDLDSYGNIQNKDAIYNLLQNLTNQENSAYAAVADPNAAATTEHNRRLAYLKEIKERMDQYDSTSQLLGEKADEYLDYITEIQEKNAEIITTKMETGVELGQKTTQRLERAIKVLGDNIYKTSEAMQTWFDATFKEGVEADKQQADAYVKAFQETSEKWNLFAKEDGDLDENAITAEDAAELFASIEDGYDGLIDDILGKLDEGKAYYSNVLEYWKEKISDVTDQIETNISTLDHYQKVLELTGRSADYKALDKVISGQLKVAKDNYEVNKRLSDDAEARYQEALKGYDKLKKSGASQDALDEYTDNVIKVARAERDERLQDYQASLESVLEKVNAWFENRVNDIFRESEKQLTGKWGSFDALDKSMARQKAIAEEYLTKTNQLYETNTMLRKLSQDIDKTDSRMAKEKLKAFSDEISAMKQQEKLTKTDLEIAKARYEVLKAQIALEEAQNAKSTVRLQRDNEGNYGYVYTADQDAIADAEQNLADKQNDLYNLVLGYTQDYSERLKQMEQEHQAALKEIAEDTTLSVEEKEARIAEINAQYFQLREALLESHNSAIVWLDETAATDRSEAWTESYEKTIQDQETYKTNTEELSEDLKDLMKTTQETQDYYVKEAKLDNANLQGSVDQVTGSVESLAKSVTDKDGLADAMDTAMTKAQSLTSEFFNQYDALMQLVSQYQTAADQANRMYQEVMNLTRAQREYNAAVAAASVASYSGAGTGGYSSSGSESSYDNTTNPIVGNSGNKKRQFVGLTFNYDGSTGRYSPYINYKDTDGKQKTAAVGQTFGDTSWGPIQRSAAYKKVKDRLGIVGGKTGMYTGSWNGPDLEENGKLAFLHQKELVLNADDTENMLNAVKLIRQISQTIDLQAAAQSSTASIQAAQFSNGEQVLQQEVTIHAEFPNATDHNEIEEAFNNLVNRASQFANRE